MNQRVADLLEGRLRVVCRVPVDFRALGNPDVYRQRALMGMSELGAVNIRDVRRVRNYYDTVGHRRVQFYEYEATATKQKEPA